MSSPLAAYQALLITDSFIHDPLQYNAVLALDELYQKLVSRKFAWRRPVPIKGVYLWGPVGRGKTRLMDLFFHSLPEDLAQRLHFHHFMARVHEELHRQKGHADPLTRIAKAWARQCKVLCFDEFFVSDIGDAMLLGRLFKALFAEGVTLVATSNTPLERLYWQGLQRDRFLPAIMLMKAHLTEVDLESGEDYRRRHLTNVPTYFIQQDFAALFAQLTQGQSLQQSPLQICGRTIPVAAYSDEVVWFAFSDLCEGPRSARDYMAIADRFSTVLVSDVPQLGGVPRGGIKARGTEDGSQGVTATGERVLSYARSDDPARRFISLIDELYDQKVVLYVSAETALETLYIGIALAFEFQRTQSRLIEMQSQEYIALNVVDNDNQLI